MEVMRRYLTEEEQRLLFRTIEQSAADLARRDFAWISLLRSTGMRVGEFATMTLGDARAALATGYIFIPKERRKGRAGQRRDHSALVTDLVRDALELLIDRRERDGALADADPLVASRKGGRMSVRAYQQRMALWAAKAGLGKGVSPHWLRHTRAMNIMRRSTAKDPRGVVQAALGHTSLSSTGIYTRPSKEYVEAALREVDGMKRLPKRKLRGHFEARGGALRA